MAARIAWADGGSAIVDAIDGDRISLVSSRAFAPGSRPEGTLDTSESSAPGTEPPNARTIAAEARATSPTNVPRAPSPSIAPAIAPSSIASSSIGATAAGAPTASLGPSGAVHLVWLKVHGSRRRADGSFFVTGRLLNASRSLLQLLKEVVSSPISGKDPAL